MNTCVRPTTAGYNFDPNPDHGYATVEYNLQAPHFNVQSIACAFGYTSGTVPCAHDATVQCAAPVNVSVCAGDGLPYIVSGCAPVSCATMTYTHWADSHAPVTVFVAPAGYDFSAAVEGSLLASSFNVTGVACAAGFHGSPTVSPCTEKGYSWPTWMEHFDSLVSFDMSSGKKSHDLP